MHGFSNVVIPLYKEEQMDKLPGAQCWLPMHVPSAQYKTLISNTDVQLVTHVLLTCKNEYLTRNRTMFENKICKYVCKYPMFLTQEKLQTVPQAIV